MNATGVKPAGQENPIAIGETHVPHAPRALRQLPAVGILCLGH